MKTSVYIPSISRSFDNLSNIVEVYYKGIMKPDELIINLSMCDGVPQNKIEEFKKKYK